MPLDSSKSLLILLLFITLDQFAHTLLKVSERLSIISLRVLDTKLNVENVHIFGEISN